LDTDEPSLENSMDGDGAAKMVGGNGLVEEVEALRRLHGDAICDAEKCREFNRRMAELLMNLEDIEEFRLADRVMDALSVCSPKTGSHCDNSERMKGILERLAERMKEMAEETAGGSGP